MTQNYSFVILSCFCSDIKVTRDTYLVTQASADDFHVQTSVEGFRTQRLESTSLGECFVR